MQLSFLSGTITVRIQVRERSEADVLLCIEVEDQGIGLTREQQQCLFQAFSQADAGMSQIWRHRFGF